MNRESLLKERNRDHALEEYQKGGITLCKAASIAGISLRERMDKASDRGIALQYSLDDLRDDFSAVVG